MISMIPYFLLQIPGGTALGQIGGEIGSSLSILKYALYIIPAVVVICLVYFFLSRRKNSGKVSSGGMGMTGHKGLGQNVAYIVSLNHRVIANKLPFTIKRVLDKDKNIETTRAIFPQPKQTRGGLGGLKDFLMQLFNRGPQKPLDEEEDGPVFSENLAIYDKERDGWFTAYTLETNTQISAFMMGDTKMIDVVKEIERNTERRVARLKSAQLAIQQYVQNATPIQQYGQMQLIGMILLFIGIIALAITLSNIGTQVQTLAKVLSPAVQIATHNASVG